jgi:dTDP-4-amino-4,6-dideoxygalactose transaminase
VRVLVLIHLFGHVDPACAELVALARRQGVRVLEDEAHAMLTDLVGGASGRLGEACVFSLHKLLPVPTGGCLVFNSFRDPILGNIELPAEERELLEFDLAEIARRRRENQETLVRLLDLSDALREKVVPLWGALPYPEVPQTVPVLVPEGLRDRLYHAMNQLGFGVVSLYHTLIEPLATEEFAASRAVSRRILNLPVHQDVEPAELERLVAALGDLVGRA